MHFFVLMIRRPPRSTRIHTLFPTRPSSDLSFYSGSVARYWIEAITGLPCNVEIASEYRYRSAVANPKHLVVTISQSGETLDTMEALKYAKSLDHDKTLSICNVHESATPRASKHVPYPPPGTDTGIPSTPDKRAV